MTPNLVLVNGLQTTLAGNLSPSATTIIVASSSGIPSIGAGQVLPLTLISAATSTTFEIVYATAISGTTLTVTRAQEGTAAGTFSVGDYVECSPTAQTVGISGIQTLQVSASTTVTPSFARTVVLTPNLTADITVTVATGNILGQKVIIYGSPASYTVNIASSVSSGSPYFAFVDGSKGYVWGLTPTFSGAYIELTWDGTNWSAETAGYRIASPAVQPNQTTTLSQVMLNNGFLANADCNTLVSPGQYLLVTPTNWANTGTTSGLLLVIKINNEVLQITSGFNNGLMFWRSSANVTNSGFPAGVPWNQILSSNTSFANLSYFQSSNSTARQSGVIYTNTFSRPMFVSIVCTGYNSNAINEVLFNVGTQTVADWSKTAGGTILPVGNFWFFNAIVPSGSTYELGILGTGGTQLPTTYFGFTWAEMV